MGLLNHVNNLSQRVLDTCEMAGKILRHLQNEGQEEII